MKHSTTISERFAHISDEEFQRQYDNASMALIEFKERHNKMMPFLENTDIVKDIDLNKSTYNLFMSLVTNGGGYLADEDSNDDMWFSATLLEEGLEETANDKSANADYFREESRYFLDRINAIRA